MSIKNKLYELVGYYTVTRRVGHTTAMLEGANYTDNALILTHDSKMGEYIKKQIGSPKNVKIESINSHSALRGHKRPLFIDNCALHVLFSNALKEIMRLEEYVKRLEEYEWKYKELCK